MEKINLVEAMYLLQRDHQYPRLLRLLAGKQGIPPCSLSDIALPETILLPANPILKHGIR